MNLPRVQEEVYFFFHLSLSVICICKAKKNIDCLDFNHK